MISLEEDESFQHLISRVQKGGTQMLRQVTCNHVSNKASINTCQLVVMFVWPKESLGSLFYHTNYLKQVMNLGHSSFSKEHYLSKEIVRPLFKQFKKTIKFSTSYMHIKLAMSD